MLEQYRQRVVYTHSAVLVIATASLIKDRKARWAFTYKWRAV